MFQLVQTGHLWCEPVGEDARNALTLLQSTHTEPRVAACAPLFASHHCGREDTCVEVPPRAALYRAPGSDRSCAWGETGDAGTRCGAAPLHWYRSTVNTSRKRPPLNSSCATRNGSHGSSAPTSTSGGALAASWCARNATTRASSNRVRGRALCVAFATAFLNSSISFARGAVRFQHRVHASLVCLVGGTWGCVGVRKCDRRPAPRSTPVTVCAAVLRAPRFTRRPSLRRHCLSAHGGSGPCCGLTRSPPPAS